MAPNLFPHLIFKHDSMPRIITCLRCGDMMPHNGTTSISDSFEVRAHSCDRCEYTEEFVVEIPSAASRRK